jgi:hypothetical protein
MKISQICLILIGLIGLSLNGYTRTISINDISVIIADDGVCTLPEAIAAANDNVSSGLTTGECEAGDVGEDTIDFDLTPGEDEINTLGIVLPTVMEPLNIIGPGADLLTLYPQQLGYLFTLRADFSLSGLRLYKAEGYRATAINQLEAHDLTLTDCVIENNTATDSIGAVKVLAADSTNHLYINNCQFIDNDTSGYAGAINISARDNKSLVATIENSLFLGNESITENGGALVASTTSLGQIDIVIKNSRFESNSSDQNGGGFYFEGIGVTGRIENSVFYNNQSGLGGAGGMWFKTGAFESINNSFIGNVAQKYAGGVYVWAHDDNLDGIHFINNTITDNVIATSLSTAGGGGLYSRNVKTTISNTVIANNSTLTTGPNCSGGVTSKGYNFIENDQDCAILSQASDSIGDELNPIDPQLSSLIDEGNHKLYQQPITGSPLTDAGNPGGCDIDANQAINYDQIGRFRHQDGSQSGNNHCDIGAIEISNNDVIFKSIFE